MTANWIAGLVFAGSLVAVAPVVAQVAPRPQRAALLQDINQRFANQIIKEMGLTQDQVPRFRRVVVSWAQKRTALEAEERRLRLALAEEFRPGVAANADSAASYVDALNANRVSYAISFQDEMKELTPILSPIQRGQFQLARDRLLQRVKDLQQLRPGGTGVLQPPEP